MASKDQLRYSPEAWARKKLRQAAYAKENYARLYARQQELRRADPERHRAREAAASLRYRTKHKERKRDAYYRHNFGIGAKDYDRMFEQQQGVCAVCHKPEHRRSRNGVSIRPLCVDHNHETGAVRGLLCHACNVSLGLLGECPDRMRALAVYTEQHNGLA